MKIFLSFVTYLFLCIPFKSTNIKYSQSSFNHVVFGIASNLLYLKISNNHIFLFNSLQNDASVYQYSQYFVFNNLMYNVENNIINHILQFKKNRYCSTLYF